jgi:energy-coupling factor transporter ATP-binding protein EcfA2
MLGRVIDGLGNPIDGKGPLHVEEEYPIYATPVNPMTRPPIRKPLDLGIRSINGLLTCGQGQRVGIMAGSGVGKSTLLGMIARYTEADINVIALIGERGRELREFIEKDLQDAGLKKSVVVVATSDQPPLVRMRGAYIATTIAEYFQSQGKKVLLMMDSVTRFAMAMRASWPPTRADSPTDPQGSVSCQCDEVGNLRRDGSLQKRPANPDVFDPLRSRSRTTFGCYRTNAREGLGRSTRPHGIGGEFPGEAKAQESIGQRVG